MNRRNENKWAVSVTPRRGVPFVLGFATKREAVRYALCLMETQEADYYGLPRVASRKDREAIKRRRAVVRQEVLP